MGHIVSQILHKTNNWAANVKKSTFGHVCPGKIQISLCIHAILSESSLGTFWIANDASFLDEDN